MFSVYSLVAGAPVWEGALDQADKGGVPIGHKCKLYCRPIYSALIALLIPLFTHRPPGCDNTRLWNSSWPSGKPLNPTSFPQLLHCSSLLSILPGSSPVQSTSLFLRIAPLSSALHSSPHRWPYLPPWHVFHCSLHATQAPLPKLLHPVPPPSLHQHATSDTTLQINGRGWCMSSSEGGPQVAKHSYPQQLLSYNNCICFIFPLASLVWPAKGHLDAQGQGWKLLCGKHRRWQLGIL